MYPCKLLLLGEYTILHGGLAVALPLKNYAGRWQRGGDAAHTADGLWQLWDYITEQGFDDMYDMDKFAADLETGSWFQSDIPRGYGLGSSGAVAAAVYKSYRLSPAVQLLHLRRELSQLENCWHSNSSGIDPLVSYIQRPILVQPDGSVQMKNKEQLLHLGSVYLLDTGISRSTAPLVRWFLEQAQHSDFQQHCIAALSAQNSKAWQALGQSSEADWQAAFQHISALQLRYMRYLIPAAFVGLWEEGLRTERFYIKICGAGGGGFLLLWAANAEVVEELRSRSYKLLALQL